MPSRSKDLLKDYYYRLFATLFELALVSGCKADEISTAVVAALREAQKRSSLVVRRRSTGIPLAALILDRWHRSRLYLDAEAKPKAIPLKGPAPSVEALLRAERAGRDVALLLDQLKSLRLIVKSGKGLYKPASNIAVITHLDPVVQQHAARSLSTLLSTIRHNVTSAQTTGRLIERFAEVPDLPVTCVHEFRRFTEAQAGTLLQTVNDWLESRRVTRTHKQCAPSVTAGLHVYAYFDPPMLTTARKR